MTPRVFVTRRIPQAGIDLLQEAAEIEIWPQELPPPYDVLIEKVKDADGLISLLTDRIDAAVMDAAAGRLKVISQMAVGFDNVDLAAATRRRIPVGYTPGVLTETTADFTWALIMAAARRVVEGDAYTRSGRWKTWGPLTLLGQDLAGATLGIIGFGRIGQAVARRAAGFGMRILYYDRDRQPLAEKTLGAVYTAPDDLLRTADIITLHVSLNETSRHMISAAQLDLMKPTAILVNTSRGAVIDEDALAQALRTKRITAAALDVTEQEPIQPDSPLLQLDNLILTPHIASASVQTRNRMAIMAANNLLAGLKGERLPHCANPQVYDD